MTIAAKPLFRKPIKLYCSAFYEKIFTAKYSTFCHQQSTTYIMPLNGLKLYAFGKFIVEAKSCRLRVKSASNCGEKMKFKLAFLVSILLTNICFGVPITGTIKELYGSNSGTQSVVLKLKEGFPAEIIQSECPSYNGYAGAYNAEQFFKSLLLSAHMSGRKVRLSVSGCAGDWLKIDAVYLLPD